MSFLKALTLGSALAFASSHALAQDVHTAEAAKSHYVASLASIGIEQPWSRALPPTAQNGAVFVNLYNQGQADALIAAESTIAKTVELHNHIHQDGLMKMVQVASIEIGSNEHVMLQPGGYHIMLLGLNEPLLEGESFPIRLTFRDAGSVDLSVIIKSVNAGTDAEHMHH